MGKRLLLQRRGRGVSQWRAPDWKKIAPARYPQDLINLINNGKTITATVKNLIPESGRNVPLAEIVYNNEIFYIPSVEGLSKGQTIMIGTEASTSVGNIVPLGSIKEGTIISNVERRPGDGGAIARSAGAYAVLLSQTEKGAIIQFPSGKTMELNKNCLATIGVIAGGGKTEKPKLKAGVNYKIMRANKRKWPRVRGKAMYAASHPHGGGSHPTGGRPVKRTAPPGQKVGFYGSKRTGRRKR